MAKTVLSYQQFIDRILTGKIDPVYFFFGSESYWIEEGIAKICTKVLGGGGSAFQKETFYGEDASGEAIVRSLLSVPMLAGKRVVIVKNFQRLSQAGKERILRYAMRPAGHSVLILAANAIDPRKQIYSSLMQVAVAVECKPPYENEIPVYVERLVEEKGKKIAPGAAQLLAAKLGNSLRDVHNEVEKLVQFTGKRKEITEQDVDELVGISRQFNIYKLRDAIGMGTFQHAVRILRWLLETGEKPGYIISSLTGYFSQLLLVQELVKAGYSPPAIADRVRAHRFFVGNLILQAGNFPAENIRRAFEKLLEADVQLKSSYLNTNLVLELMLYQIFQLRAKNAKLKPDLL
jgi:DNA polymerase-3 subunit delta